MLDIITLASKKTDNFFYMLVHNNTQAILIDPIDATLAREELEQRGLKLVAIYNTHWHPDHVGGNAELREYAPSCDVVVPEDEAARIEDLTGVKATRTITSKDTLDFGGSTIKVHALPGHTMGHIAYEVEGHLFLGDVIFAGGVGHCKLGGDVDTLHNTIRHIVEDLDGDLIVHCGHNYVQKNVQFALQFEPDHAGLQTQLERAKQAEPRTIRATTIKEERSYNPFLRTDEAALIKALKSYQGGSPWQSYDKDGIDDSQHAFLMLRGLRDHY